MVLYSLCIQIPALDSQIPRSRGLTFHNESASVKNVLTVTTIPRGGFFQPVCGNCPSVLYVLGGTLHRRRADGPMIFYSALLEVMERSGLTEKLSRQRMVVGVHCGYNL